MKIAVLGAQGRVGRRCAALCRQQGIPTILIDVVPSQDQDDDLTQHRTVSGTNDYAELLQVMRGADALIHLANIPDPIDKDPSTVMNSNVAATYNGFRAAVELGMQRITWASSVNAIGLQYGSQGPQFDYFPVDEEHPRRPTDCYALSKEVGEKIADSFVATYPGRLRIASLRFHAVQKKEDTLTYFSDQDAKWTLWGYVSPQATARSCLAGITSEGWSGHEIFNIIAPTTFSPIPSRELAQKHFPKVEIRGDFDGHKAFWSNEKARRLLGWVHHDDE